MIEYTCVNRECNWFSMETTIMKACPRCYGVLSTFVDEDFSPEAEQIEYEEASIEEED